METRLHRLLLGRRRMAEAKRKREARIDRRQFGLRRMAEVKRKEKAWGHRCQLGRQQITEAKRVKKAISFSEELVERILLRLPVKSLLRFKCVCKAWYNRISAKDFTFLHLESYKPSDVLVAGITRSSDSEFFLMTTVSAPTRGYAETATIVNHELPQNKLGERRRNFDMSCGPCNGIFCLYSGIHHIVLWNPSINDLKIIPRSNLPQLPHMLGFMYAVDFGYDPIRNDYKILHSLFSGPANRLQLHLYSLRSNSWKKLDSSTLDNSNIHGGSPRFTTKSKIGWLDPILYQIYLFDLSSEMFDMIPIYLEGTTIRSRGDTGGVFFNRNVFVFPFRESIAVLIARVPGYCDYFEIWELDDYSFAYSRSWRKLWTIQLKIPRFLEPLGFWGSSYFILRDMKDQTLVLYDLDMKDWNLVLSDLLNLDKVDPGGGGARKALMAGFALYEESLIYISDRKR